ncbi:XkdQ/YqbQ family protein [Paenibacillus pasadenensis]|uniref:Phage-like element PBSX protein xkdQ n=1 Tax=Paenibacillus pasadenensis TaxID=217090 RepID=A0A2N5N5B3_9BACL|nr:MULTISPECIES: hypothetical protein [Paenibacillus]PLT45489.1 Phage-like element PBSX protein xkdQ [Paenibacillus pasadenensis]QGG55961.1 hypothetical protein GE073_10515 [Paenibacillus sp. B01]
MSWTLTHVRRGGEELDLSAMCMSIRWSGDVKQAARKLVVELVNTADGRSRLAEIDKGGELRLAGESGAELFRGVVFADSIDSGGRMSATAYDENIYLTKTKDSRLFRRMTADGIIRQLCGEFGVPVGELASTGFVIPKLIQRDKTLYEMMTKALEMTEEQNGRRFELGSREGRVELRERSAQLVPWRIEAGRNLLSASCSQSMEEMKTQVKVMGLDPQRTEQAVVVRSAELAERFGVMQHFVKPSAAMSRSMMQQQADELLRQLATFADEARIEALGIEEAVSGAVVKVEERLSGIVGRYAITADEHSYEGGAHRMALTLTAMEEAD